MRAESLQESSEAAGAWDPPALGLPGVELLLSSLAGVEPLLCICGVNSVSNTPRAQHCEQWFHCGASLCFLSALPREL